MSIAARWQPFALPGADVRLTQFCDAAQAQQWFAQLHAEIPWERHRLRLFGREIDAPRLSCWIGDADAVYTYSRVRFEPRPWTRALAALRDEVCALCGASFNSALCNLYRDGRDAMGWHSDSEPELGSAPVIASLSFGAARRFRLRHRPDVDQPDVDRHEVDRPDVDRHHLDRRLELELESGSLLLMAGETQANYRHDLPRTARAIGPRINLTFRRILAPRSR